MFGQGIGRVHKARFPHAVSLDVPISQPEERCHEHTSTSAVVACVPSEQLNVYSDGLQVLSKVQLHL